MPTTATRTSVARGHSAFVVGTGERESSSRVNATRGDVRHDPRHGAPRTRARHRRSVVETVASGQADGVLMGAEVIATAQFLTPEQIAERTQLCAATIRRLCARGEIPGATKLVGQWRIPEDGYMQWVSSGQPEPGVMRPKPRRRMSTPAARWALGAIEGGEG
jgi:excisionase family DNA binding protein